jgi:hypothetical protein
MWVQYPFFLLFTAFCFVGYLCRLAACPPDTYLLCFGVVILASLVYLTSFWTAGSVLEVVWLYSYVLIFPMMRCPYCA